MTKKIHGRHGARWVALQGLYAWSLSGGSLMKIEDDLLNQDSLFAEVDNKDPIKISFDKAYLHELFEAIGTRKEELDKLIAPHLDRSLQDVNPIEHAILRIALYELKERLEIPYKVVINESIILAKQFGAQDSHKFVNGVLDKAAKILRQREFAQIAAVL